MNSTIKYFDFHDQIAWLFNLRGKDIPYNPVFRGYAVVGQRQRRANEEGDLMPVIYLYLPNEKHDIHVKNHLNADVSTNIYHFYFR